MTAKWLKTYEPVQLVLLLGPYGNPIRNLPSKPQAFRRFRSHVLSIL